MSLDDFADDTMDLNVTLINLVKEYPGLYENHVSPDEKQQLWRILTRRMKNDENPSEFLVAEIKQRWKNLRDAFVKDIRREAREKDLGKGWLRRRQRHYRYYKELEFLRPHLQPERKPFKLEESLDIDCTTTDNFDANVEFKIESSECNNELNETLSNNIDVANDNSFEPDHFLADNSNLTEQIDDMEELQSFFKGIVDVAKSLNPMNRIILQKEVSNLVFDLKMKELQDK